MIWISDDPPILVFRSGPEDDDGNLDIEVHLDGTRWGATLMTRSNLDEVMDIHAATGECAGGLYLWVSDLVLVRDLRDETIRAVVAALIEDEELKTAFGDLGPETDESFAVDRGEHDAYETDFVDALLDRLRFVDVRRVRPAAPSWRRVRIQRVRTAGAYPDGTPAIEVLFGHLDAPDRVFGLRFGSAFDVEDRLESATGWAELAMVTFDERLSSEDRGIAAAGPPDAERIAWID